MNLNVLVRTFGTQVSRLVPAFVQASFVLMIIFFTIFSSQKMFSQVFVPEGYYVEGYDYVLRHRGYDAAGNEIIMLEFIDPETNNLYPSYFTFSPDRECSGPYCGADTIYNYGDVGEFNGIAIHDGEDENYGSGDEDAGFIVYAAANGQVVDISLVNNGGGPNKFGWMITIKHYELSGSHTHSTYKHVTSLDSVSGKICPLESIFTVQEGDWVLRGQPIARIGTGYTDPDYATHLHFEMRDSTYDFATAGELYPRDNGRHSYGGLVDCIAPCSNSGLHFAGFMDTSHVRIAYQNMQRDGIMDPSDFIETHRPSTYAIDPEPECGGPAITWQNTIGGSADDFVNSIKQTTDGGYITVGYSNSGITGDKTEVSLGLTDYWVVKVDANGSIEWQKTIGGSGSDVATEVLQTFDDGYIICGYSNSGSSLQKSESSVAGSYDYWVVKLSSFGVIEWENTIGGSLFDFAHSIVQAGDGGYLVGGSSNSGVSGDKTETSMGVDDYWIVKLNSAGTMDWQNTIGGASGDYLYSLSINADGTFLAAGTSYSSNSGDKTEANLGSDSDYWILKLNSSGAIIWQNTIGGNNADALQTSSSTADNGYLLGGYSISPISGDKTEGVIGGNDYWIVKVDSMGNVVWQNTIGGSLNDEPYYVGQTGTDSYVVAGNSYSGETGDKCEPNVSGGTTTADIWAIELDLDGEITSQSTFGGSQNEYILDACISEDGAFVLAGSSNSSISGNKTENSMGGFDFWIVKLGGDTIVELNCEADSIPFGIAWQNTIGGSGDELFYSVDATSDGGFILGGVSTSGVSLDKTSPAYGGEDYWIVKIDECGTKEWDQSYGGTNGDVLSQVKQTSDGGYIIGGYSTSGISGNKTESLIGSNDYWVVKTDNLGNIEWQNTIGGTSVDELKSIDQTSDGGYILAGNSRSNIGGDKTENHFGGLSNDVWVVKLNSFGSIVWQNNIGGGSSEWTGSITENSDGSFILAITSSSEASADKSEGNQDTDGGLISYDMWIVKMSSTGSIVWENTIGGNDNDWAISAHEVAGGYIVGGFLNSGISADFTESPIGGAGSNDCILIYLDSSGTIVWQNRIGGTGHDYMQDLLVTDDGNYLFSGPSYSSVSGDKTVENFEVINGDLWFVKTNSAGVVVNQNVLGGSGLETTARLAQSGDGNLLLAASSTSPVSGNKTEASVSYDFWAVKVFDAACSPVDEICNSIDDDCDGLVDDGITVTVSIENFGASVFCQGGSAALGATPTPGTTLQWYKNGVAIAGATSTTYNATATGMYTCQATNACANATSNSVTITVNKNPTATIAAGGATTFCAGGSVTLTVTASAGTTKQWYKGPSIIAGATGNTYVATTAGNYKCRVTKTATGCFKNSNAIAVTVPCREGEELENSIRIFPNPTSGLLTLDIEDATSVAIRVSNVLGQTVHEQSATGDCTIDLVGLPRGSYMVTVVNDERVHSEIIVLE